MLFTIWLIGALVFMTGLSFWISLDSWMNSFDIVKIMLRATVLSVLWPFTTIVFVVSMIDRKIS